MPKQRLTESFIESVTNSKDYHVEYFDTEVSGLILRVTKKNTKSFCYRYHRKGKQYRLTLGQFPAMRLEEAKSQVWQSKIELSGGQNPKARRLFAKMNNLRYDPTDEEAEELYYSLTFSELADKFKELYIPQLRESTQKSYKGYIDRDLIEPLGDIYVNEIDKNLLLEVLDKKGINDGHPTTANKLRSLLSKMFNWGKKRDYVENNPVEDIPVYSDGKNSRDRFYKHEEIKAIWNSLEALRNDVTESFFKILFLTAQRKSETLNMKWNEVDFENKLWTIPSEDAKNYKPHDVPLTTTSIKILKALKDYSGGSNYVFESPRQPYKGNPIKSVKNSVKSIRKYSKVKNFRIHDIRRTVTTELAKMKVERTTLGKILNHKGLSGDSSVTAIYDRYSYADEKRKALQSWDDKLQNILSKEYNNDEQFADKF